MTIKIFFCYAREDEPHLNKLKTYLTPLQLEGLIDVWHDRDIRAGTEWEREISEHLNTSQIILLLVSPYFMASNYCYGIEMKRAMERHERGDAKVIPIILSPVDWKESPFGKLQALPTNAKPITNWRRRDVAYFDAAQGIREAIDELHFELDMDRRMFAAMAAERMALSLHDVLLHEIEPKREVSHNVTGTNPNTLFQGERLRLRYRVENKLDFDLPIWLGAHLEPIQPNIDFLSYSDVLSNIKHPLYYNTQEDIELVMIPGEYDYERFLTIGKDWPLGSYSLICAIFCGVQSEPGNSVRLDYFKYPSVLEIK